jgi:hypothetical protein
MLDQDDVHSFKVQEVSLIMRENKSDWYLKINPAVS